MGGSSDMAGTGPCLGCKDRHSACHAGCSIYKNWLTDLKARHEKEKQNANPYSYTKERNIAKKAMRNR